MSKVFWASLALLLVLFSSVAAACALPSYNLPIPFGMYASGAAAALVVSFVIVGYVVNTQTANVNFGTVDLGGSRVFGAIAQPSLVSALRLVSVFGFLLTIATGIFGSANPLLNFNMTFFWVIFVLGFAYVTVLIGDVYELVNPWRVLCSWIERMHAGAFRPRLPYPKWLGYYPALALYMAFIWIELFGNIHPLTLSIILLVYTGINIAAAWLFGKDAWFRYGEFFAVFFRLIGKMAPLEYLRTSEAKDDYRVQARKPFVGLLQEPADHFSLLLFVLFMLSSTAFDGAHDTLPWVGIFWKGIYPMLTPYLGIGLKQPYLFFVDVYYAWQWIMLVLSPLFYLAIYLVFIWLAKLVTRSGTPFRTLALRFAVTLIPIAFVYNITHYYTLIVSQGFHIARMISDPFNLGWNLFGTGSWIINPFVLDAGTVWHTQVGLILFGHIVSVYLAHVEALKVFPSTRKAMLSQLPMLALMVAFTTIGLWILSLPIAAGQVVDTAAAAAAGLTE